VLNQSLNSSFFNTKNTGFTGHWKFSLSVSSFRFCFHFVVACARLSWTQSVFQSMLNSVVSHCIV